MAAVGGHNQNEQFKFGPWTVTASKSHILKSEGPDREKFESQLRLPQLPEMIFADNVLSVKHADGFGIEFKALDALQRVDPEHDLFKVAVSQEWRKAREDCEFINDVVKPYDWTYTTDYMGTLISRGNSKLQVSPTSESINIEKLKVQEKIHFYADILLFEDELADNGVSILSVKIRVMPNSFFILMRQHMRIDNVIVRINDTRVYHEADKDYMIREFSSKEADIKKLQIPPHILTDANQVATFLKLKTETCEKLQFPPPVSVVSSGGENDSSEQS